MHCSWGFDMNFPFLPWFPLWMQHYEQQPKQLNRKYQSSWVDWPWPEHSWHDLARRMACFPWERGHKTPVAPGRPWNASVSHWLDRICRGNATRTICQCSFASRGTKFARSDRKHWLLTCFLHCLQFNIEIWLATVIRDTD